MQKEIIIKSLKVCIIHSFYHSFFCTNYFPHEFLVTLKYFQPFLETRAAKIKPQKDLAKLTHQVYTNNYLAGLII